MIYKCPKCSGNVLVANSTYSCQKCCQKWPEGNGYPDFLEEDFYWGEIPQGLMREVCEYARRHGWKNALAEKVRTTYPSIYNYVTAHNRADWKILLDINEQSTILDLGAGWGAISSILATHAKAVYALEGIKERAEFINIRRQQEGNLNIYPVRADFNSPPFFDKTFDLIICNGVLEWVGLKDTGISPRNAQLEFLRKMLGLLKTKGVLYIGIENRFSYGSFYGAIDHSGLPYTNLLPRICADLAVKLKTALKGKTKGFFLNDQTGYRTYTYSYRGYKQILAEAGFTDVRIYFSIPSYNYPSTLIPIEDPELYRFYLKTMRPYPLKMPKRVIRKLYENLTDFGIQRWFENAFSIIATK